jgi:hypothetical protein
MDTVMDVKQLNFVKLLESDDLMNLPPLIEMGVSSLPNIETSTKHLSAFLFFERWESSTF